MHVRVFAGRRATRVLGAVVVAVVAGTTIPSAVSAAAQAPTQRRVPVVTHVSLDVPATVTRGADAVLTAHVRLGTVPLPGRTVQFLSRASESSQWQPIATAQTDADGVAVSVAQHVAEPTEFGADYSDAAGLVRASAPVQTAHVIDLTSAAPRTVGYNASVTIRGHLVQDRVHGIAAQTVQVRFRPSSSSAWSAPHNVVTNSAGVATLAKRLTRSQQVGIRFAGANGLAASPLSVTTITVKPKVAASSSGFVFPFERPSLATSSGEWSLDQGVDIRADGTACGASAILVAVGDGTVIQEGISGFGPTAPVIRMSSGPFRGRNVYYGHTGHVYVPVGAHVTAGQRLAQIGCGRVGNSSAPHVEIGVGEPGGPPCCPPMHATASLMYDQLIAALRS
jgi:murein DD-endopeptidase MepM/ murein hydrolase activator NlpD